MVHEPVDPRHGDGVIAKDLAPGGEGLVRCDDQARALIAAGDEHGHEVRGLRVEGDVSDLVADEQRDALEAFELVLEASLALGVGQERDPLGGGAEQDALPGQARTDREGDREVGLAGAGGPPGSTTFRGRAGNRAGRGAR